MPGDIGKAAIIYTALSPLAWNRFEDAVIVIFGLCFSVS